MNTFVMNIDIARSLSTLVHWTHNRLVVAIEARAERRSRSLAARHMRAVDSRLLRDVGLQRIGPGFAVSRHENA